MIAGNQHTREALIKALLKDTNLIKCLNNKGEHLLLFLARSVGRQLVEQESAPRRKLRASTTTSTENVPENDLDPPKFAITALQLFLGNWSAVKSIIEVGLKRPNTNVTISEDQYHLNEQHGANHLDRFVFTLLARCPETQLDSLLNSLIAEANKTEGQDPEVFNIIGRFVRSVVRLLIFMCISSPAATATILATIANTLGSVVELQNNGVSEDTKLSLATSVVLNGSSNKSAIPNYRAITVSGVLSLVRTSLPIAFSGGSSVKEGKKKQINAFATKCHRVFQVRFSNTF